MRSASHFGDRCSSSVIPRSVRVSEAPSYGQSVMTYDPGSSGALAYLEAAREIALPRPDPAGSLNAASSNWVGRKPGAEPNVPASRWRTLTSGQNSDRFHVKHRCPPKEICSAQAAAPMDADQPLQAGRWSGAGTARRQRTAPAGEHRHSAGRVAPRETRGLAVWDGERTPGSQAAEPDVPGPACRVIPEEARNGNAAQKRGLGKGLGALIPTGPPADVTIALPEHGTLIGRGGSDAGSSPANGEPTRT